MKLTPDQLNEMRDALLPIAKESVRQEYEQELHYLRNVVEMLRRRCKHIWVKRIDGFFCDLCDERVFGRQPVDYKPTPWDAP